jgi:hypothetical protein
MHKGILFLSIFLLLFASNLNIVLAVSSKSIQSIELEIVKSGTLYSTLTSEIDLKLYIPQEGLESIEVFPNSWKYVEDKFGNKMIQISWKNPSMIENYQVKMKVKNSAKFFETLPTEFWKFAEESKKETLLTSANDEMRKLAFGRESAIEKASRLSIWIDENLEYEVQELKERTLSAEETWWNKKGACGEFSNLLAAMLRSQDIPVRYVTGYAAREIEANDFWGHAWVEVFYEGKWVPFDPTWLQAGYLDATHIKFANLLDSNSSEIITYRGERVEWKSNPTNFKIINYSSKSPFTLELIAQEELQGNAIGLAEGIIKGPCSLSRLDLSSCVKDEKPFFNVFDETRRFWFCDEQKIYWIFSVPKIEKRFIYSCPLVLYDQTGVVKEKTVKVSGYTFKEDVTIEGPDQVAISDTFSLSSGKIGIFFSPNFTTFTNSDKWPLRIEKPGKYLFYFYSDGQKGEKLVEVLDQKDFSFVKIEKPANITQNEDFFVNATIKNVAQIPLLLKLKINFQNQSLYQDLNLNSNEEKIVSFKLTAYQTGTHKILLTAEGRSLSSYTTSITVLEKKASLLDQIIDLFNRIINFFKSLLGLT